MKHRIAIAALATAAALGGAGALLVPAASASPSAVKSHTITFTSVEEATVNYPHSAAQQDRDVNKAGKVTWQHDGWVSLAALEKAAAANQ